ncbi:PAS domain S-box protein [Archangium violaceum]|uniref:sensor histidine kinase n=1 Tax=Archangium violaceum TaxID=83451 RepID=UPI002B308AA8|nr:PAS domain S-box protein [Archangium violaceum]
MRRPWTFAERIAVGLTASLVVALAIAGGTALALRSLLSSSEYLTENRVMHLVEVERLRRAFSEKLASLHGYELTGDVSFREEAVRARELFRESLGALRSHQEGPEERDLLEGLAQAEQAHEDAALAMREALVRGASPEELAAYVKRRDEARRQTYAALNGLARYTEAAFRENAALALLSDRQALWLILAVATLGLLVVMGLAWVLTRALWPLHHEAQASEERFRLLVEGVKDYALYLLDPEGRVASWNPGAERIQGWHAEEIIGRPGALLYPPEAMGEGGPQRELERAAREGRVESEGVRLRKDGARFWAESLITALRGEDGQLEGYAVLTRDSTERKRMERAQRLFAEAERLFLATQDPDLAVAELARLLVPELADGCLLLHLSPEGELLPHAVAHVSMEKEALLWEIIAHRRPVFREGAVGVWHVLRTGKSELLTEVTPEVMEQVSTDAGHLELIRRMGVSSALTVPLRAGGRTLGVLVLMSQRPERRFTETDRVFVEELASRAALALDNARLLREAQAALDLIGVAAHDLGNPLQALQLMLGKLRRALPSDPDKLREVLTTAVRHTQRLGRLLHNLLDLSRLSSGKLDLEVGEVDLAELVHEAVERHAEQAAEAGSRLVLDVELGVVGRWDRLRLERVLTNLLSNAFKYGKGQPIELRVARTDGHGLLAVRDHGPGIPLEQQHQIFERFKKAPAQGEKREGFGLGLYIVRQLVEAHGGTIRVESREGEGATFTVELPLAPAHQEVGASEPPPGLVH